MAAILRSCWLLLAIVLWPVPAPANDSTAELGVGGLQLVRNSVVEVTSEDLYVSAAEVRVAYRFRNKSSRPQDFLVAFPLPAIDATVPEAVNIDLPFDGDDFVGFELTVDGQRIRPSIHQRVTALGLDRTAELKALGLPLNPLAEGLNDRLKALDSGTKAELNRLGLMLPEDQDGLASWKLETTFHWTMTFPADREVVVEHRYRPVTGSAFFGDHSLQSQSLRRRYCMDETFMRAARGKLDAIRNSSHPYLEERRISYILTTASNWAAPIKRFRLVVDKGDPEALVSFCAKGVRRLTPTRFEVLATDFTPDQELEVLIARPFRER
jgi:hypothetical protein